MKTKYKNLFDLTDKVAIVTGASKGIGASIAKAFAEFGANVVVSSRSQEGIEKVVSEITANGYNAIEYMKENQSGSIINISSVEANKPDKGLGVYSISKAAISMLTKSQAKEWGKYGVRSNAICPGLIKTKLSSALWQNEEMLDKWLGDLPIRRAGDPDEISGIALYLASEASSYTTGETFNIDGGYMIN